MSYIILNENESLNEGIKSRIKTAVDDIECYKVIEERLTGSGRIEYWSYPIYAELIEDVIKGKQVHQPKREPNLKRNENGKVVVGDGFVHAYAKMEDAVKFMESSCVGYSEVRPVVQRCIIPKNADYLDVFKEGKNEEPSKCYATFYIKFCEPLLERVNGITKEYQKLEKIEKKKKFGIIYEETQINGDVDIEKE